VVTTLGAKGALLVTEDGPALAVPGLPVTTGDPCGAGDRFVTTVANRLSAGALVTEAVIDAVEEAGRFVGGGGAASYPSVPRSTTAVTISRDLPNQGKRHVDGRVGSTSPTGVVELADHMRAARGTVVVAGGCFDLLHAGHLSLLEGARRLGDCLIVAMNSDRSVRRLKGEGRPVVPEADRAALLAALGCVDAVAIFDEDSPIELLHRLRPQIFVKGGDYSARELPEDSVVRRWGGQAVVLPYLSGRSTTRLLQTANVRP
jgi:rfaE bifunctional protein nucleotidyltransferase chain/domain